MFYKDNKVEFVKVCENVNRVKLSSIYPDNCSKQEYVIVDDDTLEYLIAEELKANAEERRLRRHFVALPEDETAAAKMGAMTASAEERYFTEANAEELNKIIVIISTLTRAQRRRIYKRFKENLSFEEIGRDEGVSASAIKRVVKLHLKSSNLIVIFYKT